jgi:hypothetical protein
LNDPAHVDRTLGQDRRLLTADAPMAEAAEGKVGSVEQIDVIESVR